MKRMLMITAAAMFAASTAAAAASERPMVLPVAAQDRNEADITKQLQELGYTQLSDVRMSGDVYTATAFWEGEPLSIRIDDQVGRIVDTESKADTIAVDNDATPAEVKSALEAAGFTNVHDMMSAGSIHRAKAMRDGESYRLRVETETGVVTTSPDRTQPTIGNARQMSDAEIVDNLAKLGYSNGHGVKREGNIISVEAMHDGKPVDVNIDALNGAVTSVTQDNPG